MAVQSPFEAAETDGGDVGPLGQADPRLRVVLTVAFAVVAVSLTTFPALMSALAVSIVTLPLAGMCVCTMGPRLAFLESLLVVVLVTLPFTVSGTPVLGVGGYDASVEGLCLAAGVALKANAVVLAATGLLGGMEASRLGRALQGLGMPIKLVQLLLFTVRYVDVLRQEYTRLRRAMTARGFRPRTNVHTFRTLGSLVGMLLVRALDRAERVLGAMKCRGFSGRFHDLHAPAFTARDGVVAALAVFALAGIVGLEVLNAAVA